MKRYILVISLAMTCCITQCLCSCVKVNNNISLGKNTVWNSYNSSKEHVGQVDVIGPSSASLLWRYSRVGFLEHPDFQYSSSIMLDSSSNIVTFDDGMLVLVDTSSNKYAWTIPIPGGSFCKSPSVDSQGRIYVTDSEGTLYCVQSGSVKWKYRTDSMVIGSPLINDDCILVVSTEGTAYLIDLNGHMIWSRSLQMHTVSTPTAGEGKYYIGGERGLFALSNDGEVVWHKDVSGAICSAVVQYKSSLYFTTNEGWLYSVNTDGKSIYSVNLGNSSYSSPAINPQGEVFVGGDYGLVKVSSDGKVDWVHLTPTEVVSSPCIDINGIVYFGDTDGNLYAMENQEVKWSTKLNGGIGDPMVMNDNGLLFVSTVYNIYAYGSIP